MPDITIHPATPADIPAITAIYAHAVLNGRASFELDPPDETEMLRRLEATIHGGHPYIVCEDAGSKAVLGFAYAGPYRPRPAYRWTVESSIYVAPENQGKGIGKALLSALIDEATRRDFRQMVAVVGDSDNVTSVALHEALGFEKTGVFKDVGRKFGQWLDIVMLQRALGSGSDTPPKS